MGIVHPGGVGEPSPFHHCQLRPAQLPCFHETSCFVAAYIHDETTLISGNAAG